MRPSRDRLTVKEEHWQKCKNTEEAEERDSFLIKWFMFEMSRTHTIATRGCCIATTTADEDIPPAGLQHRETQNDTTTHKHNYTHTHTQERPAFTEFGKGKEDVDKYDRL